MNYLKIQQTGGFPLTTNTLDFLQSSLLLMQELGNVAGDLAIIRGCETTGTQVSSGVVYINGELLPFEGGTIGTNVIIRETATQKHFEDGTTKPVEIRRVAMFGNGSTSYAWSDFTRIKPLKALQEEKEDKITVANLSEKLTKLEALVKKTIPIGLVAIWDRPADEIPSGWVEHTELRGRVPAGQGNGDFQNLGSVIGESKHTLSVDELPMHHHAPNGVFNNYITFGNKINNRYTVNGDTNDRGSDIEYALGIGGSSYTQQDTVEQSVGKFKPFNIVQPTRIVKYIRFIGFEN